MLKIIGPILLGFFQISVCFSQLKNVVDLTWEFNNETVYWRDMQPFVYTKKLAGDSRGYWYAMNEFCTAEHGGTHFDAPYHFNKNGWKVSEVPLERLIAKGVFLDISNETQFAGCNNFQLNVTHLEKWEKTHGAFDYGSVLLVKFGMSQFWNDSDKYHCLDEKKELDSPGLSEEAARWLVNTGKFYGIGVDTLSVDPGRSTSFIVHRVFAKNSLYNLENVKLLDDLPVRGFNLVIAPMKLRDGTGAPARIFAIPSVRKN